MPTLDIPATSVTVDSFGSYTDALATVDTSTEVIVSSPYTPLIVSSSPGVYGWGTTGNPIDDLPPGATVTDAVHVAIGYRQADDGDPTAKGPWETKPEPLNSPFFQVDNQSRSDLEAFDGFPVGGYAGEVIGRYAENWGLVAAGQILDRFALRGALGFSGTSPIHLAYLALRVTYSLPVPPTPTGIDGQLRDARRIFY